MRYTKDDGLATLAGKIIERYPEFESLKYCRIAYLYADSSKKASGKTVYADTEKVSDKAKAVAHVDFIITFYKPNCEGLDQKRLELLMYHELRHVGYEPNEGKCSIIPHDLEDFKDIVREHGPDWILEGGT